MGGGPRFQNGRIPDNVLITFGSGWSSGEGNWTHRLSVGTYMKHKNLVALAKQHTGKTLQITAGNNAYRDYEAQVYARKMHGNGAAVPGTSSHGGWWEGQNTLAIDYHNWSYVYGGSRTAFYADVRAVGLTPGLISVPRGYPDEPWHVVDLDPWAVPAGGGSAAEIPIIRKRKDMQVIRTEDGGGFRYALVGEFTFQAGQLNSTTQANLWAQTWGDYKAVSTDGWFEAINMVNVARNALGLTPVSL